MISSRWWLKGVMTSYRVYSEPHFWSSHCHFFLMFENLSKTTRNAFETGNGEAKCVEEPGPKVSVKFLDFDGLTSSKKNQFHPPPRTDSMGDHCSCNLRDGSYIGSLLYQ